MISLLVQYHCQVDKARHFLTINTVLQWKQRWFIFNIRYTAPASVPCHAVLWISITLFSAWLAIRSESRLNDSPRLYIHVAPHSISQEVIYNIPTVNILCMWWWWYLLCSRDILPTMHPFFIWMHLDTTLDQQLPTFVMNSGKVSKIDRWWDNEGKEWIQISDYFRPHIKINSN